MSEKSVVLTFAVLGTALIFVPGLARARGLEIGFLAPAVAALGIFLLMLAPMLARRFSLEKQRRSRA